MVFTNSGKNRIRDLFAGNIHHGELGTSNAAEQYSDTTLAAADATTSLATSAQTADKQIVVDYSLPATASPGATFQEFGIFDSNNTLFARFVMASLTHSSTEQWQLSTRFFID